MIYKIYRKNPAKLVDMDNGIIHSIQINKVACGLKVDLTGLGECKSLKTFGSKRSHCKKCQGIIYGF